MSAVLVYIPPPAFANRARELAPKLKDITRSELPVSSCISAAAARAVLTTAMPITAPPRKPAIYEGTSPFFAAEAERILARVATLMPTYPARADKAAPAMYVTAASMFSPTLPFHMGEG